MNGIGWFQIGVSDAAVARRFYGELFGWTFGGDEAYQMITTPDEKSVMGGLAVGQPGHAIFCVVVQDVPAVCERAEAAGGKVLVQPTTTGDGPMFANITDPEGNHFGIFQPRA
ncbi:VOC family protein [Dactylosporangium sp. NPDC000521]|uniref:VOC family protein n=1 Tax=Dactylosporangium sp. NPDC000521 TaxID=3363975 RepID=UPI00369E9D18